MISKLPEEVIRKIASGQTASSPTAVLKELIENAIDANPKNIKIELESPFSFSVWDDGIGIPYNELSVAVQRFTTSKIRTVEDLERIKTFGFRGEALFAISQLSKLTIRSRFKDNSFGGEIVVKGGEIVSLKPVAFSKGTSVRVEELYFNAPARKSSFKKGEKLRMNKLVKDFLLAFPEITFWLNGEKFYSTTLENRIKTLFPNVFWSLVEGENFKLFFTEKAEMERKQVASVFVNKRKVKVKEIENGLEELGIKNYILFVEVPPELVDVNLSPSKEVALLKDRSVIESILSSVRPKTQLPVFLKFKEESSFRYGALRFLGSDEKFIVAHDGDYYYFFDKHLVHERVNYEKLLKDLKSKKLKKKRLVPELKVEVSEDALKTLEEFGVGFEVLENGRAVVKEIPEILNHEDVKAIISGQNPDSVSKIACKRAVKSGWSVEFSSAEELFKEFLKCSEREVCPHGRRIYVKIKKAKITSQLKRK